MPAVPVQNNTEENSDDKSGAVQSGVGRVDTCRHLKSTRRKESFDMRSFHSSQKAYFQVPLTANLTILSPENPISSLTFC